MINISLKKLKKYIFKINIRTKTIEKYMSFNTQQYSVLNQDVHFLNNSLDNLIKHLGKNDFII